MLMLKIITQESSSSKLKVRPCRTIIMDKSWLGENKPSCAPVLELVVYRAGLEDYQDSAFSYDSLTALDQNITVESAVDMFKEGT
jgi:hypothetical protein